MKNFIKIFIGLVVLVVLFFSIRFEANKKKAPSSSTDFKSAEYALLPKVSPVTVSIIGSNNSKDLFQNAAFGSGLVIDPDGYVATNYHVIAEKYNYAVVFGDGTKKDAQVVYQNVAEDIAVLKIVGGGKYQAADLSNTKDAKIGERVFSLGNGGGQQVANFSDGSIINLSTNISTNNESLSGLIQTSILLTEGDSGSPLFNLAGQVVGMNVAAADNSSFAIPADKIKAVLKIVK